MVRDLEMLCVKNHIQIPFSFREKCLDKQTNKQTHKQTDTQIEKGTPLQGSMDPYTSDLRHSVGMIQCPLGKDPHCAMHTLHKPHL